MPILRALIGAREQLDAMRKHPREQRLLLPEGLEVRRLPRGLNVSRARVAAVDRFFRDQALRAVRFDAAPTSKSSRARVSPYRRTSVPGSSFNPVRTWPPLRELAPQPMRSRSSTSTAAPARARCRAAAKARVTRPDNHDVGASRHIDDGFGSAGFRVQGSFRVRGSGFGVRGSGCGVRGFIPAIAGNRVPPVRILVHRRAFCRETDADARTPRL